MNGLKLPIHEDLSLHTPTLVNKCYQLALKVEEKLKRSKDQNKGKENNKNFKPKNNSWNKGNN